MRWPNEQTLAQAAERRHRRWFWLLMAAAMAVSPAADGLAQQTDVGIISRIREQKKEVSATSRAQIWRVGESGPARQQARLRDHDLLQMGRQVFLDIGLFGQDVESRVILGTRSLNDRGAYMIQRDTISELGGMELVVRQGVLVVEHVRGRLTAVAAGIRTQIFGTTVLIRVDETEEAGLLYLRDGRIGFDEWPDLQNIVADADGRIFRLTRGQPPVEVTLAAAARRRWEEELEYNSRGVWRSTPFWQKPQFLIPAAVAVGLGVGAAILLSGDGRESATGTVVVTIPQ